MKLTTMKLRTMADTVGTIGSMVCMLHCLVGPIMLTLGSVLPAVLADDHAFHQLMLLLVVPTAMLAFSLGCWRHRDRRLLMLGMTGLLGLTLSATLLHDLLGGAGEKLMTLVSASLLILAHIRNLLLCRASHCDHQIDAHLAQPTGPVERNS